MKSQLPFPLLFSTLAILLLCCGKTQAELITLYDATGLPGNQPWLGFAADTLSGWSQSTAPGGTQLTTNNTTRAGYSVILLGHDAKGIELGFWTNEIWAQNSDFTHAENIAIDTTIERNYRLQILNDNYQLFENNNSILSGNLRIYPSPSTPYSLPNYVFFGDDTTSAAASVIQGRITLQSNLASVPEPTSLMLLSSSTLAFAFLKLRAKSLPSKST